MKRTKEKSLLVLSATAGAGHVRAAEALVATAKSLSLPVSIRHEDVLDFTLPVFKKVYADIQFAIINRSPELWGFLYRRTESKFFWKQKSAILKLFDQFNYKKYLRALDQWNPDAVICTHFLPYAAISEQLKKPDWTIPFFGIVTDYYVHSLWLNESMKRYYVPSEETAWGMRAQGIQQQKLFVSGIPIMPQFSKQTTKRKTRISLELSPTPFTILLLSGGYGVGVIDELVPSVAEFLSSYSRKKNQLLVVCGKNQKLYETLKRKKFPPNVDVRLFQFIDFVDRLMDASDLLITKAGGLTITEALAKHLPMIIFDPIPGQETHNTNYLLELGAALAATNFPILHFKIKKFLEQPSLLSSMQENAERIARPDAAQKILEDVVKQIR